MRMAVCLLGFRWKCWMQYLLRFICVFSLFVFKLIFRSSVYSNPHIFVIISNVISYHIRLKNVRIQRLVFALSLSLGVEKREKIWTAKFGDSVWHHRLVWIWRRKTEDFLIICIIISSDFLCLNSDRSLKQRFYNDQFEMKWRWTVWLFFFSSSSSLEKHFSLSVHCSLQSHLRLRAQTVIFFFSHHFKLAIFCSRLNPHSVLLITKSWRNTKVNTIKYVVAIIWH